MQNKLENYDNMNSQTMEVRWSQW